jgi:hypothetical protein
MTGWQNLVEHRITMLIFVDDTSFRELSFEHTDVAISRRTDNKSINAFFFGDFKLKNSNFSEWNMSLMSLFIRYLPTGMSRTVCLFWILFIDLKTSARSAGCSTPDQAAFCLLAIILFST